MQLVIIAGGKGTRLKEILGNLPKPMADVDGKPLLEHQVLLARKYGIRDILILTGYGAEHIETYFGDGTAWDVRIRYQRELEPLGTAAIEDGRLERGQAAKIGGHGARALSQSPRQTRSYDQ